MDQQFRNQEISAAKELEFKSKVSQAVQIEIRKMKLAEAKEEAIKKRAQIEAEIAQKEEYEADEEEKESFNYKCGARTKVDRTVELCHLILSEFTF